VLVGDFLYSRAFQMMVAVGKSRVMDIMAETTNAIAQGEVMQLLNTHNPETTEADYLETIKRKTARLFESAGRLGAVLADAGPATEQALGDFGLHLGIAFQMIDDALDYSASAEEMGKNAIARGEKSDQQLLRGAIEEGGRDKLEKVQQIIESTGALAYTFGRAKEHAALAKRSLEALPDSPYRSALGQLADFSVSRTF
jgi:octaprenyl-diphosphate synthase